MGSMAANDGVHTYSLHLTARSKKTANVDVKCEQGLNLISSGSEGPREPSPPPAL